MNQWNYQNGSGRPGKPSQDNGWIWWLGIVLGFIFAWPVGLILLFAKINNDQNTKKRAEKWQEDQKIRRESDDAYTGQSAENTKAFYQSPSAGTTYSYRYEKGKPVSTSGGQTQKTASSVGTSFQQPKKKAKKEKKRKSGVWGYNLAAAISSFIGVMALADVLDTWIYLGLDRYIIEDLVFACLCIVAGLVSFAMGIRIRNREQRFSRYETIVGSRKSVPIAAIAETMSVSTSAAAKDIEMMVDKGYFGDKAYVDYGKMQLILDADAVDFVPEKEPEEKADSTPEIKDMPDSEREKTLAEIRRLNDAIADEQVSEKISRIEGLTDKILSRVELKPEKKPRIRSFLNYYLPTTLKLLKAYSEFEAQGVEGETITKAKESIAEILDNLIAAFEQQLDQLFSSEAMDISSDIEVLENMMRRDGFSDDGMTLGSH